MPEHPEENTTQSSDPGAVFESTSPPAELLAETAEYTAGGRSESATSDSDLPDAKPDPNATDEAEALTSGPFTEPTEPVMSETHEPQPSAAADLARHPIAKLVVMRGEKVNKEYLIYQGENVIGRTDDKPVDINLDDQEPADAIWTSRRHAAVHAVNELLTLEDLNSLNGTFVNQESIKPGERVGLKDGDVIQIGQIQLRVVVA